MQFRFIANACGVFTSAAGKTILTDPWLVDGVFEGSWCHAYPLENSLKDLQDVDGIYLSHIHPDHYDPRHFEFRRDIPIFVLDHGKNFMHKNLTAQGYTNLIPIKDGEKVQFEDYELTMFAEFTTHIYDESRFGTLIDSAKVLENDGLVAFNPNDNKPDVKSCIKIKERFGHIDLVLLNSNAAGAYPACFSNLSHDEKLEEKNKIEIRYLDHSLDCLQALQPSVMIPFAGFYCLGGKLHKKNQYLASPGLQETADYLNERITFDTKVLSMRENDIFNLKTGQTNRKFVPYSPSEIHEYIETSLSNMKYEYEADEYPDIEKLKLDIVDASQKMHTRWANWKFSPDMQIRINIDGNMIDICKPEKNSKGVITCSLDTRLLRRILDRDAHWANSEIGAHIEFHRSPNHFSPDIHTMLSFFHC